jgi:hypothetical protein
LKASLRMRSIGLLLLPLHLPLLVEGLPSADTPSLHRLTASRWK